MHDVLESTFVCIFLYCELVQGRRTRGVLKIERYAQRLAQRACMEEASSYSWAPNNTRGPET